MIINTASDVARLLGEYIGTLKGIDLMMTIPTDVKERFLKRTTEEAHL
jgi:hypothetical protein